MMRSTVDGGRGGAHCADIFALPFSYCLRAVHFADFAYGGKYHMMINQKISRTASVLLAAVLLKSAGQGTLLPAG